jgi:hypothetical protein
MNIKELKNQSPAIKVVIKTNYSFFFWGLEKNLRIDTRKNNLCCVKCKLINGS